MDFKRTIEAVRRCPVGRELQAQQQTPDALLHQNDWFSAAELRTASAFRLRVIAALRERSTPGVNIELSRPSLGLGSLSDTMLTVNRRKVAHKWGIWQSQSKGRERLLERILLSFAVN